MQAVNPYPEDYSQVFQTNRSPLAALVSLVIKEGSAAAGSIPPTVLLLLSTLAVQVGAVLAKQLFTVIDPIGATLVRTGLGAFMLLLIWQPQVWNHRRRDYGLLALSGLAIAGTNLAFYSAISHIPLGIASAIEFIGPLGVALVGSRRLIDLTWVILAAVGLILLTPISGAGLNLLGICLALISAGCWAAYIFLAIPVSRVFPGQDGLTLAMMMATVFLLPFGMKQVGVSLLNPTMFTYAIGLALLACVVPYSLEFSALKRLPPRIFGILISIEPAIATMVGFILLGESLGIRSVTAIGLIVTAAVGSTLFNRDDSIH